MEGGLAEDHHWVSFCSCRRSAVAGGGWRLMADAEADCSGCNEDKHSYTLDWRVSKSVLSEW